VQATEERKTQHLTNSSQDRPSLDMRFDESDAHQGGGWLTRQLSFTKSEIDLTSKSKSYKMNINS
jgi:hypothetical protein